jgi:hypothetical protein
VSPWASKLSIHLAEVRKKMAQLGLSAGYTISMYYNMRDLQLRRVCE